jgi:predicted ATPase
LDIVSARGLTPLVGRESEVTLLLERWEQVKDGQGHVILLTGDAGIGKSRLVQVLKERVTCEQHVQLECRSLPYYQNTALYPIVDLLQRILRWQPHHTPEEKLTTLVQALSQYRLPVEESVQLFAPLLSVPIPEDRYPALNLSPQRQRQKTLETLIALLLEQAEHQPVLFILEDLHWTDPSTLELLGLLLDQTLTASMLVLLTCRPSFQPAWHHCSYLSEITVNRLSHAQVAQIVNRMTDGKTLPTQVLAQIVEKTDGVPLFVEEITKAILESGQLKALDGHYELVGSLSTFTIPATLHDALMARLDRLATVKVVAQLGATLGRTFTYELLQTVSHLDELELWRSLVQLVEAEVLYQRGELPHATYTFKHALLQEVAYQSLLRSTRQQYHQRIAHVFAERFPETVATQPELLAHHCTEAGLVEQAVGYWYKAGQRAHERSAYLEAIAHLRKGLEMLTTLPDTLEHRQQELDLQVTLGRSLMATKGLAAPDAGAAYHRAHELCQQVGETPQLFLVLGGLVVFYISRREYQTARELGEQMLSLTQRVQDPAGLANAYITLGNALYFLREFDAARSHLEQGVAFYKPQQHRSQGFLTEAHEGVFGLIRLAGVLWALGYPDQALQRSDEALTLAHELSQPYSLATALVFAAEVHMHRREGQSTYEQAEAALGLAREHGFAFRVAQATILRGWTLVEQGQGEAGIAQMCQGQAAHRATGSGREGYSYLLAEAYGKMGQTEEGLRVVAEALARSDNSGGGEAELYRLKGELLLTRSSEHHVEAESCFRQALDIARRQEVKSLELRAAMSLSCLWQQQGRRAEAYQLLAPVYSWFTEGFDTADLQEAKALLDKLRA